MGIGWVKYGASFGQCKEDLIGSPRTIDGDDEWVTDGGVPGSFREHLEGENHGAFG